MIFNPPPQFSRLGIQVSLAIYVYLSGLWFGGLLHLSFFSDFLKLVCYAQSCISMYIPKHIIHVLMRDEKEERSKQGQTNKQGTCQT